MTLLLLRAKPNYGLTILLSALLACPVVLPLPDRDDLRLVPISNASLSARPSEAFRTSLHAKNRKASMPRSDWSVVADEPESPDGRDDFRYTPPGLPHRPIDFPRLIPAALEPRPIAPIAPVATSTYIPPLRC